MKKLYICTIITSFEKVCVLIIIFTKAGLHKSNLFWMGQYDPTLNLHIGRRTNPLLKGCVHYIFTSLFCVWERERERKRGRERERIIINSSTSPLHTHTTLTHTHTATHTQRLTIGPLSSLRWLVSLSVMSLRRLGLQFPS